MTDQRNRVTTDPGLGPIEREHASTLRSITAADPIPEDEIPGAPVYYEPKPLHAVSDHKTLELETVKLSKDIDPRKLPTELKLRRPVLHVLPASDPNWPAPPAQPDVGWPPAQYDSGWPPPETVLTTSQPPLAARRRSYIPLVLLVLLSVSLLLVLGARARRRSLVPAVTAQAMQPAAALTLPAEPKPLPAEPAPSAAPSSEASTAASATPSLAASPESAASAESPESAATALASATPTGSASATQTASASAPHHAAFKPIPPSNANSQTLNAQPTAKPKRAIY